MTELRIVETKKLCSNKAGLTAAYKAGFVLQEKGWLRYPAASWGQPALLAFDGEQCVGGLNYEIDDDELTATVLFAFCDPAYPTALSKLLLRFRHLMRQTDYDEIKFTCHTGNEQMAKAVRLLKLEPISSNYRLSADRLRAPAKHKPASFVHRIAKAIARMSSLSHIPT